jgi:hypothetical protein
MSPLSHRLIVVACVFVSFTAILCAAAYVNARWIVHNPDAALPLMIIIAVTGLVGMVIAFVNVYFRER